LNIYRITKNYSNEEKFGLISQLRRAAASPTNLVEGFKRRSNKDFAHFVNVGEASLEELKYLLILSMDLGYIQKADFEELNKLCEEIGRMLAGLYKTLRNKNE
jgi:four helix bundle protein